MHVLGKNNINKLQNRDKWLLAWLNELAHAQWRNIADVLEQFPKAQRCNNNNSLLFHSDLETYSIEVHFAFPQSIALIINLKQQRNDND